MAIDSNGVISLAGVGSLVDSGEKLKSWLDTAFNSKNKLYNEIKSGLNKDKTNDSNNTEVNSGNTSSDSSSVSSTEQSNNTTKPGGN